MSGTRSLSPTEPRTEPRSALIVAHGSPSYPAGPEADIKALAAQVALRLPDWTVEGATLAAGAALDKELEGRTCSRFSVYPFFMSDGWFVREELPRRLRDRGIDLPEILPPFGCDRAVPRLCEETIIASSRLSGVSPCELSVLVVGHGSESAQQPLRSVAHAARCLAEAQKFREVRVGFLEGSPSIAAVAGMQPPAICLPLFTGRARHVKVDLPEALEAASWSGTVLEPLGLWPSVPNVIAGALRRHCSENRLRSAEDLPDALTG